MVCWRVQLAKGTHPAGSVAPEILTPSNAACSLFQNGKMQRGIDGQGLH